VSQGASTLVWTRADRARAHIEKYKLTDMVNAMVNTMPNSIQMFSFLDCSFSSRIISICP